MSDDVIEAGPLQRVRLDVSYDGTEFSGWALQPGQRTVQDVLQDGLATVLRRPVRLTVAGRTDAGVHAVGQVAHLDLPASIWATEGPALTRRLAGILPADLRVRAVSAAPEGFDARFSALWRRYEYRLTDVASGPAPLRRRSVVGWPRPLAVEAMASAAEGLLGLQDFAAFCRRREGATTVRTLEAFTVTRVDDEIVCALRADAFCHSMVRSLVGALLAVGDGRQPTSWPSQLLGADRRADSVTVAPARGLTLMEVRYPDDAALAARAEQTRAKRERRGDRTKARLPLRNAHS